MTSSEIIRRFSCVIHFLSFVVLYTDAIDEIIIKVMKAKIK